MKRPDVALIEFHDARLDGISIGRNGRITFSFGALAVFLKKDERSDDVWTYRAELIVSNASDFRVRGAIPETGWLTSDDVELVSNEDRTQRCLLDGCDIRHLRFVFENGCQIDIDGGEAVIALSTHREFLETFEHDIDE